MRATLIAMACIAVIVFQIDALAAALIYDRDAVAAGQLWRLVTSALVHLSPSHLALDVAAVLLVAMLGRSEPPATALAICVLISTVSSLYVLVCRPEMRYFGGLSGIATGLFAYIALMSLRRHGRHLPSLLPLAALLVKTGMELGTGGSLAQTVAQPFTTVAASHAIGLAVALLLALLPRDRPVRAAAATITEPRIS